MQVENNIPSVQERKKLKDFVPLVITFYTCLVVLSLAQNLRLYFDGVLDSFLNTSFFLLLLHHTGFSALVAFILAFLFNFLESKKANLGYAISRIVFIILIVVEALLIEHYVQNYDVLGYGMFSLEKVISKGQTLLPFICSIVAVFLCFYFSLKFTKRIYRMVSRMYPFTIILFSLFLATLNTAKNPINENKTQHYIQSTLNYALDFNKYQGKEEYPLLKTSNQKDYLGNLLSLKENKPNIMILIIDGLGSDFIGESSKYSGFTPFLDSLAKQSIRWTNHLSNTGEGIASLPMITGSLPFGKAGYTNISEHLNNQSLFSLLKKNGYTTSFNYGGNSALNSLDKFLDQERVDEVLDKKGFGHLFSLQEEDAAGITLGYPDHELYRKWLSLEKTSVPRLDVFLNLSTKDPYLIPKKGSYLDKVDNILSKAKYTGREERIISRNKEVFASLAYADDALKNFITRFKKSSLYNNTLFIVTGSHNVKDVPQDSNLERYQVPLLFFGPRVNNPKKIEALVSHADITPSLIQLLKEKYAINEASKVAWLGDNLIHPSVFKKNKQIPLYRDHNNIQDFIDEDRFVSRGNVFEINNKLELFESDKEELNDSSRARFKNFRAINSYVTKQNKIIPIEFAYYPKTQREFTKAELVWIQSVFNGKNFDNAYNTARELAFNKEWERALLLSRYILSEIPRHADTEVLIGRIYAWQKQYSKAIVSLRETIRKYPNYTDAYAAILDAYYWSGNSERATNVFSLIDSNEIESEALDNKVERAKKQIKEKALEKSMAGTELMD